MLLQVDLCIVAIWIGPFVATIFCPLIYGFSFILVDGFSSAITCPSFVFLDHVLLLCCFSFCFILLVCSCATSVCLLLLGVSSFTLEMGEGGGGHWDFVKKSSHLKFPWISLFLLLWYWCVSGAEWSAWPLLCRCETIVSVVLCSFGYL
jgi:hypothetical protein